MITHSLFEIFNIVLKLILLGVGILYLFRVLWLYHSGGAKAPLKLTWSDPARSAEGLVIWLGLQVTDKVWSGARWAIHVLEDASADVGEWFLGHRGAGR